MLQELERTDAASGRVRLCIYPDLQPESPREWSNLGEMVHWHRRYDLGDRRATQEELDVLSERGFDALKQFLGAIHLIPLGLLDHSGLHMFARGGPHWSDGQGWDSGTVGFIYTTEEKALEAGLSLVCDACKAKFSPLAAPHRMGDRCPTFCEGKLGYPDLDRILHGEIVVYDQYLTGDVYGYVVETATGEHLDSCWGFYGPDAVREAGQEALQAIAPGYEGC